MGRLSRSLLISAIAAIPGLSTDDSTAAVISVPVFESSFELPDLSGSAVISPIAIGWENSGVSGGTLNPVFGGYGGPAPAGFQVGWTLSGSSLYQDLAPVIAGATYTFSVDVGTRYDIAGAEYQLMIGFGGTDLATTNLFGVTADSPPPIAGTYVPVSLVATAPLSASGDVLIFLESNLTPSGGQGSDLWDIVSVTATTTSTPEPGSLTLLGLGLASFGGTAWLKKRQATAV